MLDDVTLKSNPEGALTEEDASRKYRMSVAWFQRKRWDGTGPKFYKIGRAVRYPAAELDDYFSARIRSSTSDTQGGVVTSQDMRNAASALANDQPLQEQQPHLTWTPEQVSKWLTFWGYSHGYRSFEDCTAAFNAHPEWRSE